VLSRKFAPYRFDPDREVASESLAKGLKSSASSISLFMLFRVDIYLINYFLGTEQAGLYSIAVILSELLQKFANTAGTVLFPKIAGERNVSSGHRLSLGVLFLVSAVGLVFAALLAVFGREIIVLLYKERYAAAVSPLMWLLPGTVVMAVGKIFMFSLWGRGFPPSTYIVPLCALVLNATLNAILIPRYGIDGAAFSTSFSYCVFGVILASVYAFHAKAGFTPKG
jgi:O-antigen/teichoic acid export membrane protein